MFKRFWRYISFLFLFGAVTDTPKKDEEEQSTSEAPNPEEGVNSTVSTDNHDGTISTESHEASCSSSGYGGCNNSSSYDSYGSSSSYD